MAAHGDHHSTNIVPYNPWWPTSNVEDVEKRRLPSFRREPFDEFYTAIQQHGFSLTIVGPRRVGKSTIMRQLIDQLLTDGVPPQDILRYQLDDPFFVGAKNQEDLFEQLLMTWESVRQTPIANTERHVYCFLDEVQRFPRWELFVKRMIDLKWPVTFVLSGSASTTLFRKSRESLLGRVKEYHLTTFSFAEILLLKKPQFVDVLRRLQAAGAGWHTSQDHRLLHAEVEAVQRTLVDTPGEGGSMAFELGAFLGEYFLWGGFPHVWELQDPREKQEYLLQNHVEKVIREDLMLVRNIKVPDKVERLFLHLIHQTGEEVQETRLASESGLQVPIVHEYLDLLEQTDLVTFIPKFRKKPGIKRTAQKVYATDLALRNAALKYQSVDDVSDIELGHYAETVVFRTLREWPGTTEITYFRERDDEIDFIVSAGRSRMPIEVKYRQHLKKNRAIQRFAKKHKTRGFVQVTKHDLALLEGDAVSIPLRLFLLLFRSTATR